jgi:hypothetical protein
MTLYSIALFLHIVGALLLFTVLSLEGVALRQLWPATTADEARVATGVLALNRFIGPVSALGILVPGFYMTATSWGPKPWIIVALAAWVVIAVFGAVNGVRTLALVRAGSLDRLRSPFVLASWLGRVGVALGVVFLMTLKPDAALAVATIVVAAAAGVGVSLPLWRRLRTPGSDPARTEGRPVA